MSSIPMHPFNGYRTLASICALRRDEMKTTTLHVRSCLGRRHTWKHVSEHCQLAALEVSA